MKKLFLPPVMALFLFVSQSQCIIEPTTSSWIVNKAIYGASYLLALCWYGTQEVATAKNTEEVKNEKKEIETKEEAKTELKKAQ